MEVEFLASAFEENHYPPPDRPEIAFAGRSNAGKSTLVNVLVDRKKAARTSSTPGRTQALNFFLVDRRIYFVDLPGYGFARAPIAVRKNWRKMVETYLRTRANLKGVVVVVDIRRDASSGDRDLLNWLRNYGIRTIPVLTKADKLSRQAAAARAEILGSELSSLSDSTPVVFSAKTKLGRDLIWGRLNEAIGS